MDMTLLDFKKSEKYAFADVMESLGLRFTEYDHSRFSNVNEELWKRLEKGLIDRGQLLATRFGIFSEDWGVDPARLNALFIKKMCDISSFTGIMRMLVSSNIFWRLRITDSASPEKTRAL